MDSLSVRSGFVEKWFNVANNWLLLQREPRLFCIAGPGKRAPATSKLLSAPLAWAKLLMPELQALCLRVALLRDIHVTQREETVGGGTRDGVHEEPEVTRLRQRSIAAVADARRH